MDRRILSALFLGGLFCFVSLAPALGQEATTDSVQPLSMEALIDSIRANHPIIQSARARREQADTAVQRAQGAFDLNLNQTTLSRLGGFYDGQYLEQAYYHGVPEPEIFQAALAFAPAVRPPEQQGKQYRCAGDDQRIAQQAG